MKKVKTTLRTYEDLLSKIKVIADKNNRSMNKEIQTILEAAAKQQEVHKCTT